MSTKIKYIILTCIVILGFILRIYNLSSLPSGFFCDEASTGYNAYLITQTGHDEYGKFFPVFFQSFGNFRPGVPFYFSAPFIKILGLSEFSTRLPSVIIGTLTIILIFLLCELLFTSQAGILAAFFLSISPWHIQFSRYGAENIYLPFFLTLGTYLFLQSLKRKKKIFFLTSILVFGIGIYTYFQAYYIIPLWIFMMIALYWKQIPRKHNWLPLSCVIFMFCLLPLLKGLQTGETLGRLNQVATANEKKSIGVVATGMITTYIDHFKPEFLFQKGDIGYHTHFITRFSVRGIGELYWFQLPLILLGLIFLFRYKKPFIVILFWLLIYPLGSTLAPFADGGGPFATRSIIGVIPFQILTSLGILSILSFKKVGLKQFLICVLIGITLYSVQFYMTEYFVKYPSYSSDFWGWQYGAKDIVHYFVSHQSEYEQMYMQPEFNAPFIFFKFYAPRDCGNCQLGTIDTTYNASVKQLYAVTPAYLLQHPTIHFKAKKILYYPNKQEAFRIGEVVSL